MIDGRIIIQICASSIAKMLQLGNGFLFKTFNHLFHKYRIFLPYSPKVREIFVDGIYKLQIMLE